MKALILFRHAKAEKRAPSGDDFDRALTKSGVKDAALMGRVLADAGFAPDAAVVSAAKRTRETWEHAAAAFADVDVAYARGLYNAGPRALLDAAESELKRAGCVVVVAHNPGVHELAVALMQQGGAPPKEMARAQAEFPPATIAAFTVERDGTLSAARVFFPADHGGKGE